VTRILDLYMSCPRTQPSWGGYLYVVQEREFARSGESVFKIGFTRDLTRRMSHYPKNSRLVFAQHVADPERAERAALGALRSGSARPRRDLGAEYFEVPEHVIAQIAGTICCCTTAMPMSPKKKKPRAPSNTTTKSAGRKRPRTDDATLPVDTQIIVPPAVPSTDESMLIS
jgi:hypothetical protein